MPNARGVTVVRWQLSSYRAARSSRRFLVKGSFAIAAKSRAVWARCFLNSLSNISIPPVTSSIGRYSNRETCPTVAVRVWISWVVHPLFRLAATLADQGSELTPSAFDYVRLGPEPLRLIDRRMGKGAGMVHYAAAEIYPTAAGRTAHMIVCGVD